MPNYDAGHYFLTVLAPIRPDPEVLDGISRSRRHLIQDTLTLMPSGERTSATQGTSPGAPFARTTRTHFARFVVLDDVVFNGRVSGNSLLALLRGTDPLVPQTVDRLTTPYLIFVADFDAASGDDAVLQDYASCLWGSMQAELVSVFRHCVGFDKVESAEQFFRYLKACQIETTMPFNDYWSVTPDLPGFNYRSYLIVAVLAAILLLVGAFGRHLLTVVLALAVLGFLAVIAVNKLFEAGARPFPVSPPPAPGADLPTVLKALYLQRRFTDFAISAQGLDDAALHAAFGTFLAQTCPGDVDSPTQPPGVIGVDAQGDGR